MRARFIWKNNQRFLAIGLTLRRDQPDAFFDRGSNNLKLSAAAILSIIVHIVVLLGLAWLLKVRLDKHNEGGTPPPLRVTLTSPAKPAAAAPPPAPPPEPIKTPEPVRAPPPPRHLLTAPARTPTTPAVVTAPAAELPPLPLPPPPNPNAPPQEDMMSHINAQREKRASENAHELALERGQSEDEIGKARALANLAASRGPDQTRGHGGEFELHHTGLHDAEFTFHGWNETFRRNGGEEFTVSQGSAPSIELAVIDKYIEIIRREEKGSFQWFSEKKKKSYTLSARPEDTEALRTFLMRDIYDLTYPTPEGGEPPHVGSRR